MVEPVHVFECGVLDLAQRRDGPAPPDGSGKQDRKAYVRNQRLKAPQDTQRLEPGGLEPRSNAHPHSNCCLGNSSVG